MADLGNPDPPDDPRGSGSPPVGAPVQPPEGQPSLLQGRPGLVATGRHHEGLAPGGGGQQQLVGEEAAGVAGGQQLPWPQLEARLLPEVLTVPTHARGERGPPLRQAAQQAPRREGRRYVDAAHPPPRVHENQEHGEQPAAGTRVGDVEGPIWEVPVDDAREGVGLEELFPLQHRRLQVSDARADLAQKLVRVARARRVQEGTNIATRDLVLRTLPPRRHRQRVAREGIRGGARSQGAGQ